MSLYPVWCCVRSSCAKAVTGPYCTSIHRHSSTLIHLLIRSFTLTIVPPRHIWGKRVNFHGRVPDKFGSGIRTKVQQYPCEIVGVTICDDDVEMIVAAANAHLEKGADFLVFTGGMSVDPDDLTPAAIRKLGTDIVSHGVPAQPGNMMLVAYLGEIPILGIPGAAIRRPTTIFDVLLPQIFAGEKISREELISLADGGLCQMCENCHWPNCTFGRY